MKKTEQRNYEFTFVSSASFNTYDNLFSFGGRVELFMFPTLPTRCIAEIMSVHKW